MSQISFQLPPEAITALREAGVATLYLFGSRASGMAGPMSDFDFAVLLDKPESVRAGSFDIYNKVYDILSAYTHPATIEADVIDIIFLDSPRVPLELKNHVIQHGLVIVDADPTRRANFESKVMLETADFAPIRKQMRAALLQRI